MIHAATLRGITAIAARVTARSSPTGLRHFKISGLSQAAERETRVRVQAALQSSGVEIKAAQLDVAIAAGGVVTDGTGFDLAIALAIAADVMPGCSSVGALGELSLAGEVRPVRGALAAVEALKGVVSVVLVAPENGAEAVLALEPGDTTRVIIVRRLTEALNVISGIDTTTTEARHQPRAAPTANCAPDMRDVCGQRLARRALEIAAAGGHNILFVGGPGSGKTMLARRLPGLLPRMTDEEALEVTRVHSAAGLNIGGSLIIERPFRAPHHSTTPPGLVGGGAAQPRPGEVTLAHHGVLFLDELTEFSRPSLEMLREPLMTGEVVLSRASGTLRYPSRCMVVGSMSPCPCGKRGTPRCGLSRCRCQASDVARYRARASDALLGRFDIQVLVPTIDLAAVDEAQLGEPSAAIAARVAAARDIAAVRTAALRAQPPLDGLDALAKRLLERTETSLQARQRCALVARTIADLDGSSAVTAVHLAEAQQLAAPPT